MAILPQNEKDYRNQFQRDVGAYTEALYRYQNLANSPDERDRNSPQAQQYLADLKSRLKDLNDAYFLTGQFSQYASQIRNTYGDAVIQESQDALKKYVFPEAAKVSAIADVLPQEFRQGTPGASAPSGKTFYRVGTDIYEASTGRKLGPTEWNRDWSGKATEVSAPATPGSSASSSSGGGTASVDVTSNEPGDYSGLPKSLTDSPDWKSLTEQQKKTVALTYNGLKTGNKAAGEDANAALEQAKKLADPYYKGLISLAQDELTRGTMSTSADAQSRLTSLKDKISQIDQDLALGREDLSIEERADLAKIKRDYEEQLKQTTDQALEAGLAFSSPRQEAERQLMTNQQEIAQSTSRKYARQKRDMELQAQRQQLAARQDITDTERKAEEQRIAQARATEAKVGTANVAPGTPTLGTAAAPITGSIESQRQAGILDLEQSILKRSSALPF